MKLFLDEIYTPDIAVLKKCSAFFGEDKCNSDNCVKVDYVSVEITIYRRMNLMLYVT